MTSLRVLTLYPDELNIYADRGNLLFLEKRSLWRGIPFTSTGCGVGEGFDPAEFDLIYIGGGQDRDQEVVGADLLETKGAAIEAFVEAGRPLLAVCGGYQLLGTEWAISGERREGLGVFDSRTERGPGERLIGPVAIETVIAGSSLTVAGFENHAGRTWLEGDCEPFGTVVAGRGNNGADKTEGARKNNAFGTYLHGPLLPKNFRLADLLIAIALDPDDPASERLSALDDEIEELAHREALDAALRSRSNRTLRSPDRNR